MKRLALFIAAGLAGCATSASVEQAPAYLALSGATPVSVQGDWAYFRDGFDGRQTRGEHLSRHGKSLDRIWIVDGLRPGQRLVEASAHTQDGPVWDPSDLQGLAEGSLWALGYGGVAWRSSPDLGVEAWGAPTAFTTRTERGLDYRGILRARQRNMRLDLVIWVAEAGVYAPRTQEDAEAMITGLK